MPVLLFVRSILSDYFLPAASFFDTASPCVISGGVSILEAVRIS